MLYNSIIYFSSAIFFWIKNVDRKHVLTQLSSNAGMSVWQIVWAMTNSCFMSDMFLANIYVTNWSPF